MAYHAFYLPCLAHMDYFLYLDLNMRVSIYTVQQGGYMPLIQLQKTECTVADSYWQIKPFHITISGLAEENHCEPHYSTSVCSFLADTKPKVIGYFTYVCNWSLKLLSQDY